MKETETVPVEGKNPVEKWRLGACQKLDVPDAPWHLVDIQNSPNKIIANRFGQGMLWKDEKGNLRELELNSLGLTFEMKNEKINEDRIWQAYSREYPGFFISSNQQYRGMEPIPGAFVLENKDGKRKLVVPLEKYNLKATGPSKQILRLL